MINLPPAPCPPRDRHGPGTDENDFTRRTVAWATRTTYTRWSVSALVGVHLLVGLLTLPCRPASAVPTFNATSAAKSWLNTHHGSLTTLEDTNTRTRSMSAGSALHKVKLFWRDAGGTAHHKLLVYDASGTLLADAGKSALAKLASAQWQQHGVFTKRLSAQVSALSIKPSSEPVVVDLLLAVPYTLPDKSDPAAVAAAEADYSKRLTTVRSTALARLAMRGVPASAVEGANAMLRFTTSAQTLATMRYDAELGSLGQGSLKPQPQALSSIWGESVKGWNTGFDGLGVSLCLIEEHLPLASHLNYLSFASTRHAAPAASIHAAQVGSLIASSHNVRPGLAKGASVHLANWHDGTSTPPAWHTSFDWCASLGSTVWNLSLIPYDVAGPGPIPGDEPPPSNHYLDHLAVHAPYPTIVAAAGNYGNGRFVANQLYNGIVVGGSVDSASLPPNPVWNCNWYLPTADRSLHRFWTDEVAPVWGNINGSHAVNPSSPNGDWELPHVVAPAVSRVKNCLQLDYEPNGAGTGATSAATAITAALAAQVQQVNGALSIWPEANRAILMASANEDVDGVVLKLTDSTDDKDGAGEVNGRLATELAAIGNHVSAPSIASPRERGYDYATVDPQSGTQFPGGIWTKRQYVQTSTTEDVRVALSWSAVPMACSMSGPVWCDGGFHSLPADFDLAIVDTSTGSTVASSTSYDNNYEFVQFTAAANKVYELQVKVFSPLSSSAYLALAWVPTGG